MYYINFKLFLRTVCITFPFPEHTCPPANGNAAFLQDHIICIKPLRRSIWWIIILDCRRRGKPCYVVMSINKSTQWYYFFLEKQDGYSVVHILKSKHLCRKTIIWATSWTMWNCWYLGHFSLQIQPSHTVQPNRNIALFYKVHIASGGKRVLEHWATICHHKKALWAISVIQRNPQVFQKPFQCSEWRDLSKPHVPILEMEILKNH